MRKLSLLFALVPLLCTDVEAQITVEDYRREVASYSRRLHIAHEESLAAAEIVGKSRTGYLPELSVGGDFDYSFRHAQGVRAWNFALRPRLVQLLYGGGGVQAEVRRAELNRDIALCNEQFAEDEVRYAADYAYWNLSAMGQYLDAMREYVAIVSSLMTIVEWRFREGYISKGDVLMIEARMSEAEYGLVTAEQNFEVALHNFNILRGAMGEESVVLTQSILDSIPMPLRISTDEVLLCRSDIYAARLGVAVAEEGVRQAAAPFNPRLEVGVEGAWSPYSPNVTGRTRIDGSLFVGVSVPIFHWGERRRATSAARAEVRRSEWQVAQLRDDILREELNGWTNLVETSAQVNSTTKSLRIAGENLELSTYSYSEGLTTILDVLQAQLSWIQLYTNAITARYHYALSVAEYERVTARRVD